MERIKLEIVNEYDQFCFHNVNGDFIGRLSPSVERDNSWLFCGVDFFKSVTPEQKSMFWIDGTYEHAIEKINMLVEKYVNRFFEKERFEVGPDLEIHDEQYFKGR